MVTGKLRKEGDRWIVVLPEGEVEQLGLEEGQELEVSLPEHRQDYGLDPEIETIARRIIRDHREALDYLAK